MFLQSIVDKDPGKCTKLVRTNLHAWLEIGSATFCNHSSKASTPSREVGLKGLCFHEIPQESSAYTRPSLCTDSPPLSKNQFYWGEGVLYTGYTRPSSGELCNPILEYTPKIFSYPRVKILQKLQRFYVSLLLMSIKVQVNLNLSVSYFWVFIPSFLV